MPCKSRTDNRYSSWNYHFYCFECINGRAKVQQPYILIWLIYHTLTKFQSKSRSKSKLEQWWEIRNDSDDSSDNHLRMNNSFVKMDMSALESFWISHLLYFHSKMLINESQPIYLPKNNISMNVLWMLHYIIWAKQIFEQDIRLFLDEFWPNQGKIGDHPYWFERSCMIYLFF
jgi:hypothetical protein